MKDGGAGRRFVGAYRLRFAESFFVGLFECFCTSIYSSLYCRIKTMTSPGVIFWLNGNTVSIAVFEDWLVGNMVRISVASVFEDEVLHHADRNMLSS